MTINIYSRGKNITNIDLGSDTGANRGTSQGPSRQGQLGISCLGVNRTAQPVCSRREEGIERESQPVTTYVRKRTSRRDTKTSDVPTRRELNLNGCVRRTRFPRVGPTRTTPAPPTSTATASLDSAPPFVDAPAPVPAACRQDFIHNYIRIDAPLYLIVSWKNSTAPTRLADNEGSNGAIRRAITITPRRSSRERRALRSLQGSLPPALPVEKGQSLSAHRLRPARP